MYLRELAAAHAPDLAKEYNANGVSLVGRTKYHCVRAGDQLLRNRLSGSFAGGNWRLQSAAGSEVDRHFWALARTPHGTLTFCSFERSASPEPPVREHLDDEGSVSEVTFRRATSLLREGCLTRRLVRLARTPDTAEEVEEAFRDR